MANDDSSLGVLASDEGRWMDKFRWKRERDALRDWRDRSRTEQ